MESANESDGLTLGRRGDRVIRRFTIAPFACRSRSCQRERQNDGREFVAEAVLDPAAETLGKIIADPQSAPRSAPRRPRSIVQDDAVHHRADCLTV